MKKIVLFFLIVFFSYASTTVIEKKWPSGWSLLTFLSKYNIDKSIYFNLGKNDKELCSEIKAGVVYQTVFDKNQNLRHLLVPISDELQIHIFRDLNNTYKLEIIPIIYKEVKTILKFNLQNSPYLDILKLTNNKLLANEFVKNFKKFFNFKRLHKNDFFAIVYKQKIRLGRYFTNPNIIAAFIKTKYRKKFIIQNPDDGRYYDDKGRSLTSVYFIVPLRYKRISDRFTYKRYHPILHRYMAHLGIDYAAPYGRRIWASGDGRIIYKGRKGGYGNCIIIRHSNGYKSLYGHLSRFARIRRGQYVKQGKIIGYVGSTGRSTGPHLHFGIYKNGKAINPERVLGTSKKILSKSKKRKFLKFVKKIEKEIKSYNGKIFKLDSIKLSSQLEVKNGK